ncbi:MAG: nucleoside deaminase [Chitinophagales bacterium]|nr:nucleoside deaminase [Chitinophagales bacterium]
MDDVFYINRCNAIGLKATEKGNPPVGALVVKGGQIIAEAEDAGRSKNDITCHAEIEAIRMAVKSLKTNDLSDCTLYSSHEPCIMCSYSIRFYRINKVVYGEKIDFLGGISSSMPLLTTDKVPKHWSQAPEIVHFREKQKIE